MHSVIAPRHALELRPTFTGFALTWPTAAGAAPIVIPYPHEMPSLERCLQGLLGSKKPSYQPCRN